MCIQQIARSDCTCILGNRRSRTEPVIRGANRRRNKPERIATAVRVSLLLELEPVERQSSVGDHWKSVQLRSTCQSTGTLAQPSPPISTWRAPPLDFYYCYRSKLVFQLSKSF